MQRLRRRCAMLNSQVSWGVWGSPALQTHSLYPASHRPTAIGPTANMQRLCANFPQHRFTDLVLPVPTQSRRKAALYRVCIDARTLRSFACIQLYLSRRSIHHSFDASRLTSTHQDSISRPATASLHTSFLRWSSIPPAGDHGRCRGRRFKHPATRRP